jgi:hypothetical protein
LSGVGPHENPDGVLGAATAVLPGVALLLPVWLLGLYALAVGVALIVLALRLRWLRRGRGRQDDLNPREEATDDHATRRHKRARGRRPTYHEPL